MKSPIQDPMSLGQLFFGYLALCALLALAVAVPYLHLGRFATAASFTVASLKLVAITAIFMRVLTGSRLYLLAFALGFLFVGLLVTGSSLDFFSRALS